MYEPVNPCEPYELLPRTVPIVVAARIAGLSPETFKRLYLKPGYVRAEDGRVVLSSLSRALDRLIDLQEWLRADRRHDDRRRQQRTYARNRRAA